VSTVSVIQTILLLINLVNTCIRWQLARMRLKQQEHSVYTPVRYSENVFTGVEMFS